MSHRYPVEVGIRNMVGSECVITCDFGELAGCRLLCEGSRAKDRAVFIRDRDAAACVNVRVSALTTAIRRDDLDFAVDRMSLGRRTPP